MKRGDAGFPRLRKWYFGLLILLPLVAAISRERQTGDVKKITTKSQHAIATQQKSTAGGHVHTMTYQYNEQGRLVGVDYGDSLVITYSYDPAGNLLSRTIRRGSLSAGEEEVEQPFTFELAQNYPNPFNPTTTLRYQLPDRSHVNLTIYNVLGQEVRTLVDGTMERGEYTIAWNGKDRFGKKVASGIFFYRIQAEHYVKTRKMIILK